MNGDRKKVRPGPDAPDRPQPGPPDQCSTTEQLRADIDRGNTGDKVAFPDPSAAPLGTDAEAAGTPVSPEALAYERRHSAPQGQQEGRRPDVSIWPWMVGLAVAALLVVGLATLLVP